MHNFHKYFQYNFSSILHFPLFFLNSFSENCTKFIEIEFLYKVRNKFQILITYKK